jgi:hypothetical protein
VISPEGRYCGLAPPQNAPAVGRAHRCPAGTWDGRGMLFAAFANSSSPIYKLHSMSHRVTMTVKKTATHGGTEGACAR